MHITRNYERNHFKLKIWCEKRFCPLDHVTRFGKWSPSWKGPYRVVRVIPGNAYFVETLNGRPLPKALNGKYLKNSTLACGKELESQRCGDQEAEKSARKRYDSDQLV
jgi:hypothetical protein